MRDHGHLRLSRCRPAVRRSTALPQWRIHYDHWFADADRRTRLTWIIDAEGPVRERSAGYLHAGSLALPWQNDASTSAGFASAQMTQAPNPDDV